MVAVTAPYKTGSETELSLATRTSLEDVAKKVGISYERALEIYNDVMSRCKTPELSRQIGGAVTINVIHRAARRNGYSR
jgi:molybdenum-dependent DNA-binding transcriptional regulator ModE